MNGAWSSEVFSNDEQPCLHPCPRPQAPGADSVPAPAAVEQGRPYIGWPIRFVHHGQSFIGRLTLHPSVPTQSSFTGFSVGGAMEKSALPNFTMYRKR